MDNKLNILQDSEIEAYSEHVDFGSRRSLREVIETALLKNACDFHNGSTSTWLLKQLGLTNDDLTMTDKGQRYLYAAFKHE